MSMPSSSSDDLFYEKTFSVQWLQSVPRFGHTRDISMLVSSNQQDLVDYSLGVLGFAISLAAIFVLWSAILFFLFGLGARVGFLSGFPFVAPLPRGSERPSFRRPRRVRITFLACASALMTFTVLLVMKGLSAVEDTTTTLNNVAKDVRRFIDKANNIADSIISAEETTQYARQHFVLDMKNFCPNHDLSLFFGENQVLLLHVAKILDTEATDFVQGDLRTLKTFFDYVKQNSEKMIDMMKWREALKYIHLYWIPLIILSNIFFIGTILAWIELSPATFRFVQSYALVPIFCLMILASSFFANGISFVAFMNADACSGGEPPGSPEGTIMKLFEKSGMNKQKMLHSAIVYYTEGCLSDNPFRFISDYRNQFADALTQSESIIGSIKDMGSPEELSELCGKDITPTLGSLGILVMTLRDLRDIAKETIVLLSCENVLYPLYRQTFHEAICTQLVNGLGWMLSSLVAITICGMTMIMLRASLLHIDYAASCESVPTSNENDAEREETLDELDCNVSPNTERNDGKREGTREDHEYKVLPTSYENSDHGEAPQDYEWYERNRLNSATVAIKAPSRKKRSSSRKGKDKIASKDHELDEKHEIDYLPPSNRNVRKYEETPENHERDEYDSGKKASTTRQNL